MASNQSELRAVLLDAWRSPVRLLGRQIHLRTWMPQKKREREISFTGIEQDIG